MRARPQWRLGWRKGGDHHLKRGFLQSKFFKKILSESVDEFF
jgi:hypothetical protein